MLALIAAVAENGVIGKDNDLPWYLPADLQRFKDLTTNHTVIMGHKTYDSIVARLGHALPNRTNIVLTSEAAAVSSDVQQATSLAAALELVGNDDAFVIGGARAFAEALPIADMLFLTEVKAKIDGDVFFPEYDTAQWSETERVRCQKDAKNEYDYDFVTYEKLQ